MENSFFQLLLVLFGFFLGGIFPVLLSDCGWRQKLFSLLCAVHISESSLFQRIIYFLKRFFLALLLSKSNQKSKLKLTRVKRLTGKTIFSLFLLLLLFPLFPLLPVLFLSQQRITLSSFFQFYKIQFSMCLEYIKIGFFWGIFVDALKVGS